MEKISKLKKIIKEYKIDGYVIPKNDEFFNEYVPKNKDNLRYISNFSGSYGFALILKNENYLFVDGRYILQAKIESGNKFKIRTIPNSLPSHVLKKKKLKIGFDPKLYTELSLNRIFRKTNCKLISINENLIDKIWNKQNKNKVKKFYLLNDKITGQNYKSKINSISKKLRNINRDLQFVSAPENIAWLLNIRGGDSEYSPIPNSYLIIDNQNKVIFLCDLNKIDNNIKNSLKKIKIIDITLIKKTLL